MNDATSDTNALLGILLKRINVVFTSLDDDVVGDDAVGCRQDPRVADDGTTAEVTRIALQGHLVRKLASARVPTTDYDRLRVVALV